MRSCMPCANIQRCKQSVLGLQSHLLNMSDNQGHMHKLLQNVNLTLPVSEHLHRRLRHHPLSDQLPMPIVLRDPGLAIRDSCSFTHDCKHKFCRQVYPDAACWPNLCERRHHDFRGAESWVLHAILLSKFVYIYNSRDLYIFVQHPSKSSYNADCNGQPNTKHNDAAGRKFSESSLHPRSQRSLSLCRRLHWKCESRHQSCYALGVHSRSNIDCISGLKLPDRGRFGVDIERKVYNNELVFAKLPDFHDFSLLESQFILASAHDQQSELCRSTEHGHKYHMHIRPIKATTESTSGCEQQQPGWHSYDIYCLWVPEPLQWDAQEWLCAYNI